MHNSQYVTQCNTVHNKTLQSQKCNNRLSNHMTYLLKYYVSAFTNTKSDHTLPIIVGILNSLGGMMFCVMPSGHSTMQVSLLAQLLRPIIMRRSTFFELHITPNIYCIHETKYYFCRLSAFYKFHCCPHSVAICEPDTINYRQFQTCSSTKAHSDTTIKTARNVSHISTFGTGITSMF